MNRTELVMELVLQALTGLATTGTNVTRDLHYPWPEDVDFCLSIREGVIDRLPTAYKKQQHILNIPVEVRIKVPDEPPHEQHHGFYANQIDAEVFAALMAAFRRWQAITDTQPQPYSWIQQIVAGQRTAPTPSIAAENRETLFTVNYLITFETSLDDLSA